MLFLMLIAVGGLARDGGYPLGVAVLSTILIWAAPGQVVFFAALAAGASLPAAALAIGISSIRLMPMVVSLLPLLKGGSMPLWKQLLLAHFIAVTAWVEGIRRLPGIAQAERVPFFLAFVATIMSAAVAGTAFGFLLVGTLPASLAAGIIFVAPIYFTLSAAASAREGMDWLAIFFGFALSPAAVAYVPDGFDLMVIGVVGGTLAYAYRRWRKGAVR